MATLTKLLWIWDVLVSALSGSYRHQSSAYQDLYNETMRPRSFKDDKRMMIADKHRIARDMRRAVELINSAEQ